MILQRLVPTFTTEDFEVRTVYRQKDASNPGAKTRNRKVAELARTGLREALKGLEGHVDVVGTRGYEVREDAIVA